MSKHATEVQNKNVLRVDAGEPLADRLNEIRSRRASHVAVFAGDRCVGVSSFGDHQASAEDRTFEEMVEKHRSVKVAADSSLEELCHAFTDPRIDALIVEGESGEYEGVVTRQSMLEALVEERNPIGQSRGLPHPGEHGRAESLLAGEKRILEVISTASSVDGGLTEILEFIETHSNAAACSILLLDDTETHLRVGASKKLKDDVIRAFDRMIVDANSGVCGAAVSLNRRVVVPDISTDPLCREMRDALLRHKLNACSSTPIHSSVGKVLGTITLFFKCSDQLDDSHVALIDRVVHLAAIAIERKRAEDALRASETRSRTLLEGSPVCTKIIDLDSRLQYMSTAGKQQLKICELEPFYGNTFPPDLYPPEWRKLVIEHLDRAKTGTVSSLECPVLDTNGEELWYDTTFVPACDESGQVQYIIVTSVNITERRQAEEAARKHREELAHVARVSTMGELATGIAHELNQPLSAISSYSNAAKTMLEQNAADRTELGRVLDKLEEQSIRAGDLLRRLREFVTKSESARLPADLGTLVQDVVALIGQDIRMADTVLTLRLNEPAPIVLVDHIQIQQVLVNLIRNAIDAMKDTAPGKREIKVATRLLQDGQAEVEVSDSGKGLVQDDPERVFGTFFSTKQNGMGMGLPISRSIVEAHGGRLWSKPNVGPGATFGFTIPLKEKDGSETVFIVDDDASVRDSLSMVVQGNDRTVKCFASAEDFLEILEPGFLSNPVCLIADMQMPNMGGIELLSELESLGIKIPVILITGHGTPALKQRAKELGAVAVLEKPFQSTAMQKIISETLESFAD